MPAAAPITMLGVPFDPMTLAQALQRISDMIMTRQPHYVVTANVDFLVQALHDVELHRIMLAADLVLCDGTPLVWMSRWLGNPLPERVAGSDLVPQLIGLAVRKHHRIFFLGGAPEVAERAMANLRLRYPELDIAGHYSPPHAELLEMDHEEITRRIREAKPDILFVSFGCPKAEKWMAMHYRSLGVPVTMGVGATIDFLAGRVQRAPRWMRRSGTEWLYRLMQEPRRLWRRYATDLRYFGMAILRQRIVLGGSSKSGGGTARISSVLEEAAWVRLQAPERLDALATRLAADVWGNLGRRHCLVDMGNVRFIDSTGVGMLLQVNKRLGRQGCKLVLISPSQPVRRVLKMMQLTDVLMTATDATEARRLIESENRDVWPPSHLPVACHEPVRWPDEVTVANTEKIWLHTLDQLTGKGSKLEWVIDLDNVRFIDSTGANLMLRLKKFGAKQGVSVRFENPRANILNVLRLAQLEGFLWEDEP